MRNPWRIILLRNYSRTQLHISTTFSHFQVQSSPVTNTLRSFSSLLHNHSIRTRTFESALDFRLTKYSRASSSSSDVVAEEIVVDPLVVLVTDIFSKGNAVDEITKELELNSIDFTHDLVLNVLRNLELIPDVARKFFNWISKEKSERLSSKAYNLMLSSFGVNGFSEEFWTLFETMKAKGYGVSKAVYVKSIEKFEKEGLENDVEKLRGVYALGSIDKTTDKISSRISKIIKNEVWGDEVEVKIRDLNVSFSNDLVKMVLEKLAVDPMKAYIFFRWVEESNLIKHDEMTYNAMLIVLGREDCIDRFWKVANEMRGVGFEMEKDTYITVLEGFLKSKMVKHGVDLYEFAMTGANNKPSVHECTHLLKKIVVSKEFDMSLFSQVVKACVAGGNVITNSMLDSVLKSLTSVGKIGDCNRILSAMENEGLVAKCNSRSRIAFGISRAGEKDEVKKFISNSKALSDSCPKIKIWESLIEGYCASRDVESAFDTFHKMVENEGVNSASRALDLLVNAYCNKNKAIDACKLFTDMVSKKELKPWHDTYKALIIGLVHQGSFNEALNVLGLMKNNGYPPYLNPLIKYVSKTGTSDDAIMLLKAMSVKKYPSTQVYFRLFEGFFEAKRKGEAQDFLSKCPGYIRNNPDVLNRFCSLKSSSAVLIAA